jgi:NAD(P)H-dependent FMN reductase
VSGGIRPRIALVIASTRRERFADLPAEWLRMRLRARSDLELTEIDIRDVDLPFYDADVPPARAPREYHGDEKLRAFGEAVDAADAFIVLTAEYNHGYPAALKNALDHVFVEFTRKPIAFAGYGNVGGARAIEQLRQVAVELEMAPIRHAVSILGHEMRAARAAGVENAAQTFANHDERLTQLVDDLVWWANALRRARGE